MCRNFMMNITSPEHIKNIDHIDRPLYNFDVNIPSYCYRNSHYGAKMMLWWNANSTFLYWNGTLYMEIKQTHNHVISIARFPLLVRWYLDVQIMAMSSCFTSSCGNPRQPVVDKTKADHWFLNIMRHRQASMPANKVEVMLTTSWNVD